MHHHFQAPSRKARSTGVSLLFALLSLVALTLAAVALVRSVDTGTLVLGNLSLKQDATSVSDKAATRAIDWLSANAGALNTDALSGVGYYATANEDLDATGQQIANDGAARSLVNWDLDGCAYAATVTNANCKLTPSAEYELGGNKYRYVILRLCDLAQGPKDSNNSCAQPLSSGQITTATRGAADYSTGRFDIDNGEVYYRIIVRVVGPRKTTSYIETIVHL
ncbi:MAG: pilus assembly protein PilX [Rubrivivax sp.]|nr:MAG: pilus assembly protein PilX [Rubrivivax sp.]